MAGKRHGGLLFCCSRDKPTVHTLSVIMARHLSCISDEWASVDGSADNIVVFGKVFCVDDVFLQNSGGILRTKLVQRNVAVDP